MRVCTKEKLESQMRVLAGYDFKLKTLESLIFIGSIGTYGSYHREVRRPTPKLLF
jgi:hypothetical protein